MPGATLRAFYTETEPQGPSADKSAESAPEESFNKPRHPLRGQILSRGSFPALRRHIFYRQQDEGMAGLHLNPAGVELHLSGSEVGKIMAHFEIIHAGVSRDDFLE